MNDNTEQTGPQVVKSRWKLGLMGKLALVTLLVLFLQIPLFLVNGLRMERESLKCQAVSEISSRWGAAQTITGPILVLPYVYRSDQYEWETDPVSKSQIKRQRVYQANAFFLPENLEVDVVLDTELRKRGIYTASLYTAKLRLKGNFAPVSWESLGVKPETILWSQARIVMGVSDVRGLRELQPWGLGAVKRNWEPGTRSTELRGGLHSPLSQEIKLAEAGSFEIDMELQGSGQFSVVPVGKNSVVRMRSGWADPSFEGRQLPTEREVGPEGFHSLWKTSHLSRAFGQQWTDADKESQAMEHLLQEGRVGVNLLNPVDAYRTIDRAIKHGILFMALVFTAFFVVENMGRRRPLTLVHYALVGAAICLFYLGLLALSEFVGFGLAYALSAGAGILLVTCYSSAILGGFRAALVPGGVLSLVYGYLFFVLQMQDYALLAGSGALFAALAGLMWVTRREGSAVKE